MAQNFDLNNTGQEVQQRLDQVPTNTEDLASEVQARMDGDVEVAQECKGYTDAESERAQGVEQDLQAQINEIVGGGATVNLTVSPSPIFVGEQKTINLSATASVNASAISITGGNLAAPITGSGKSVSGTDTLTPNAPGSTPYNAVFTIAGQQRTASRSVTAVYPIYFGSGMAQGDVLGVAACKATARTSPAGTYNVVVADSPKYIWFFVPANMPQITSAKMNGFDFPLQTLSDVTDEHNVTYKVYRSPNTNETGSYNIIINQ